VGVGCGWPADGRRRDRRPRPESDQLGLAKRCAQPLCAHARVRRPAAQSGESRPADGKTPPIGAPASPEV